MASKKSIREKYSKGMSKVYCMFFMKPHNMKDLFKKEGRYDVCRDPDCIEDYYKDKSVQANRTKQETRKKTLEENYPDPTWMVGE